MKLRRRRRTRFYIVPVKAWHWIWLNKIVYGACFIPLVIMLIPYTLARGLVAGLEWCTGKLGSFYIRNYNKDLARWKRERDEGSPRGDDAESAANV